MASPLSSRTSPIDYSLDRPPDESAKDRELPLSTQLAFALWLHVGQVITPGTSYRSDPLFQSKGEPETGFGQLNESYKPLDGYNSNNSFEEGIEVSLQLFLKDNLLDSRDQSFSRRRDSGDHSRTSALAPPALPSYPLGMARSLSISSSWSSTLPISKVKADKKHYPYPTKEKINIACSKSMFEAEGRETQYLVDSRETDLTDDVDGSHVDGREKSNSASSYITETSSESICMLEGTKTKIHFLASVDFVEQINRDEVDGLNTRDASVLLPPSPGLTGECTKDDSSNLTREITLSKNPPDREECSGGMREISSDANSILCLSIALNVDPTPTNPVFRQSKAAEQVNLSEYEKMKDLCFRTTETNVSSSCSASKELIVDEVYPEFNLDPIIEAGDAKGEQRVDCGGVWVLDKFKWIVCALFGKDFSSSGLPRVQTASSIGHQAPKPAVSTFSYFSGGQYRLSAPDNSLRRASAVRSSKIIVFSKQPDLRPARAKRASGGTKTHPRVERMQGKNRNTSEILEIPLQPADHDEGKCALATNTGQIPQFIIIKE